MGQLEHGGSLTIVIPAIVLVTIVLGISATIGIESFGRSLGSRDPLAVSMLASAIGAILVLFHTLGVVNWNEKDAAPSYQIL